MSKVLNAGTPDAETAGVTSHLPESSARRRPSADFSLTGPLIGPLWIAAGISMFLAALLSATGGRWVLLPVGVITLLTGAALTRVEVARLPRPLLVGSAYFAVLVMAVASGFSRGTLLVFVAMVPALLVWVGLAMELSHLVAIVALCEVVLLLAGAAADGLRDGLATVALTLPLFAATSGACFTFRRLLDSEKVNGEQARDHARAVEADARARSEAEQQELAAQAAVRLQARERLQANLATQASELAAASAEVSDQTQTVATAAEQMSSSFSEINRTAQASEEITASVAEIARRAQTVMEELSSSSSEIMTASSVIRGVAEKTNLLALNATIESARAGDTGRGFAVVAQEVKDLARQSGQHADTISGTLAQVEQQVRAAVAHVVEITSRMQELQSQNGTLASAMEQQSAAVGQIVQSIHQTAGQTERITEGIRSVEQIAQQA
ncbi:MAG: hypothetical protein JNL54_10825 [Kineosporiaceae bacterium]|nr:hypothetical protein [Kineosporiaceae bacterium]